MHLLSFVRLRFGFGLGVAFGVWRFCRLCGLRWDVVAGVARRPTTGVSAGSSTEDDRSCGLGNLGDTRTIPTAADDRTDDDKSCGLGNRGDARTTAVSTNEDAV
jgi:hypothetical protein